MGSSSGEWFTYLITATENTAEEIAMTSTETLDTDSRYMAVLIAPDGEWVTDFPRETVQEVWDCVNDMGSRWIFYPLVVVVTVNADGDVDDESTVASYPDGLVGPDSLSDFLADVRGGELQPLFELMGC